jgi:hypothetical protein
MVGLATASQSSRAKALASSAIAAATSASPAARNRSPRPAGDGVSCATLAMRTLPGRSRSPASDSSSRISAANRLDLPAPLRPTTPTRQPGMQGQVDLGQEQALAAAQGEVAEGDHGGAHSTQCDAMVSVDTICSCQTAR